MDLADGIVADDVKRVGCVLCLALLAGGLIVCGMCATVILIRWVLALG